MTLLARPNLLVNLTGPLLLVALAYLTLPHLQSLPEGLTTLLPLAPYLLAVATGGLGVIYERPRIVLTAAVLVMGYWIYTHALTLPPSQSDLYYSALSLLLPLNLAWLANREENGLFSRHGLIAWGVIVGQVIGMGWILQQWPGEAFSVLAFEIVVAPRLDHYTNLPQLSLVALTLALLWTLVAMVRQRTLLAGGQLGALAAVAVALQRFPDPSAGEILFSCALFTLAIALAYHAYYLAYVDELTGLPGRRAFNEALHRLHGQYVVAMLDVDHFKSFNDTYGHDVGDQVLKMVAAKIRQVGGGGRAFRYGGEEFSILFPNKTVKQAFPYLSNVREAVDKAHLVLRGKDRPKKRPKHPKQHRGPVKQVHVTISIGMAEPKHEGQDPEEVTKAADQALYRAKEKGRNRLSR